MSTNQENGSAGAYEQLKNLGAQRLGELRELGSRLFEHMSPRDLGTILFPPALGLDVLRGLAGTGEQISAEFDSKMPDPELLGAVLAMARWFSLHYFKTTIEGVAQVPVDGPALLVGNHSAGLMPVDALFAINAIRDHQENDRIVHPLVHDFAYTAPRVAKNARRMGILRAGRDTSADALRAGRLVLVYPGGDKDAFRTFAQRKKIVLAGRRGFVKLAMDAGVPIVPLVSVGLHESFVVLSRGERLANALGLKKILRTDIFPVALSFPWGLAPAFFPFMPLPTAIDMRFLPPIAATGDSRDEEAVNLVYKQVQEAMQTAMDELHENRIPLFGR